MKEVLTTKHHSQADKKENQPKSEKKKVTTERVETIEKK
jgi:hypothetical protein